MVKKLLFFSILWLLVGGYLYMQMGDSPRSRLQFIRLYILSNCYLGILWPLWFYAHFDSWKSFFSVLVVGAIAIAACTLFSYYHTWGVPTGLQRYLPNFIAIFVVQWGFLCVFCSMTFFVIHSIGISSLWAAFLVSMAASAIAMDLYWCSSILAVAANKQNIIAVILHSNPLVASAACFPHFDYLRLPVLYERCPIGADYPFHYPLWYHVSIGCVICTGVLLVITRGLQLFRAYFGEKKQETGTDSYAKNRRNENSTRVDSA